MRHRLAAAGLALVHLGLAGLILLCSTLDASAGRARRSPNTWFPGPCATFSDDSPVDPDDEVYIERAWRGVDAAGDPVYTVISAGFIGGCRHHEPDAASQWLYNRCIDTTTGDVSPWVGPAVPGNPIFGADDVCGRKGPAIEVRGLPLRLTGTPPEQAAAIVDLVAAPSVDVVEIELLVWDADLPEGSCFVSSTKDGQTIYNGALLTYDPDPAVGCGEGLECRVTTDVPAGWLAAGEQSILCTHDADWGYEVRDISFGRGALVTTQ